MRYGSVEIFKFLTYAFAVAIAAMATFWANESFHAQFASNLISLSSLALGNAQQMLSLQIQLVQYCRSGVADNVPDDCPESL